MENNPLTKWELRHELKPGDIGYLTYLHGILYAKEYKYDQTFEAYVAHGLVEFVKSFNPYRDRIWLAEANGRIVGSIAVVRTSKVETQLRWFLVHPEYRGHGLGKSLIHEALKFCKERKYNSVFLWTTSELTTASHLYAQAGFKKTDVKSHNIWGKYISEERYDLNLKLI
ncbi:MAG: GNAT family N-acetyltransferase [Bacteroidales bacterium]|nr:GNAT family N-acetyltransferase [Bacteroidales bacterium]